MPQNKENIRAFNSTRYRRGGLTPPSPFDRAAPELSKSFSKMILSALEAENGQFP